MERLSNDALLQLQQWVAKEFIECTENIEAYSQCREVHINSDGEPLMAQPDPEQVELWSQRRGFISGISNALNELQEHRKALSEYLAKSDEILKAMS